MTTFDRFGRDDRMRFIRKALHLSERDLDNETPQRWSEALRAQPGFEHLRASEADAAVAAMLGYPSAEALETGEGSQAQLSEYPDYQHEILDAMSWRLYLHRSCSLPQACSASRQLWLTLPLTIASFYPSGFVIALNLKEQKSKEGPPRAARKVDWAAFASRKTGRATPPPQQFEPPSNLPSKVTPLEGGRFFIPELASDALDVANAYWDPACGKSRETVLRELIEGATVSLPDAMRLHAGEPQRAWPPGLTPVQYQTPDGRFIGYGLQWNEVGALHALVFGTPEDFADAILAIWRGQPAHLFAITTLPDTLIRVAFENPWRPKRGKPKRDEHAEPDFAIIRTDGHRLVDDISFDFDSEPFCRPARSARGEDFDGRFGLMLRPVIRRPIDHLHALVPYAFGEETYRTYVRVVEALEALGHAELRGPEATKAREVIAELAALTCEEALPVEPVGYGYARQHEPLIAWDEDSAGAVVRDLYPQLAALGPERLGQYAVHYYGKNASRGLYNTEPDDSFLAYVLLRNLGLNARGHHAHYDEVYWGLIALVRRELRHRGKEALSGEGRRRFELEAKKFWDDLQALIDMVEEFTNIEAETSRLNPAD